VAESCQRVGIIQRADRQDSAYSVRMSNSNPLNHLGEVVAEAMRKEGISENEASLRSGISRQTLRRRLRAGGFKDVEMFAVARALELPASELVARVERGVA
jgi:lambda repressor-like predicted transcriptional regulator